MKRDILNKDDCPSKDFTLGSPSGSCWGDGHHRCNECIHYREDFKRLGQNYVDFAHDVQAFRIEVITPN